VGSEDEHGFVRREVVRFMREHRDECDIDEPYLHRMSNDGVWATDVEIRATARLLKTPILTWVKYNDMLWQWHCFAPGPLFHDSSPDSAVPSLYIRNTNSCHYDVVASVMNVDDEGFSDSRKVNPVWA